MAKNLIIVQVEPFTLWIWSRIARLSFAPPSLRIAPKVLLPGRGVKRVEKDTLRQKWLLPWAEWMNQ
jgi:hypothetical protein